MGVERQRKEKERFAAYAAREEAKYLARVAREEAREKEEEAKAIYAVETFIYQEKLAAEEAAKKRDEVGNEEEETDADEVDAETVHNRHGGDAEMAGKTIEAGGE